MKLVREFINEKFTEDSDPIKDMGIGILSREAKIELFKQYMEETYLGDYPFEIEDYYGGLIATVYYNDGETEAELPYYWDDEENIWKEDIF